MITQENLWQAHQAASLAEDLQRQLEASLFNLADQFAREQAWVKWGLVPGETVAAEVDGETIFLSDISFAYSFDGERWELAYIHGAVMEHGQPTGFMASLSADNKTIRKVTL